MAANSSSQLLINVLLKHIDSREFDVLRRYIGKGETQVEIALALGRPQTSISATIRQAVAKLNAAGFDIETPGRGRRKETPDLEFFDPAAFEHLRATKRPDGRHVGRWTKTPKVNRSDL